MPSKCDHLQRHGGTFRVVMGTPQDVRPTFGGRRYFLQPLGTANPNEANRLKGAHFTRWRTEIARARRTDDPDLRTLTCSASGSSAAMMMMRPMPCRGSPPR
jgi:hypothetical protein